MNVIILGSGITGISAGYHLKKKILTIQFTKKILIGVDYAVILP